MTENVYKIRGKERHNVEVTITLSQKRERDYLAAMQRRFQRPTWGFSRLLPRVLREWYALFCAGALDGIEADNGQEE